jgi:Ca2+-binding RTX toxin-like protein
MNVTVTGGAGNSPVSLTYDARDTAFLQAQALAATIDATFSSATYYDPHMPHLGATGTGYLIISDSVANNRIDVDGFAAVVDQNNGVTSTVAGAFAGSQVFLAGDGGLTFFGRGASTTVVAGGGNNYVTFRDQAGSDAVYTGTGNDTVVGGSGALTVSAGAGNNVIHAGAGSTAIISTGQDFITLGSGNASVTVGAGGSDYIKGTSVYGGSGYNLTFVGGDQASTVRAGVGSYSIFGGAGGGVFDGGTSGNNSIIGGTGAATIFGGGAGDSLLGGNGGGHVVAGSGNETLGGGGANTLLVGGSGSDSILVGSGNETVQAGSGSDTIQFGFGIGGAGVTDVIRDFSASDLINLSGFDSNAVNYALSTFTESGHNGSFQLEDGTKVVLIGVTHLSASNFT